jgi:hypothetical protein
MLSKLRTDRLSRSVSRIKIRLPRALRLRAAFAFHSISRDYFPATSAAWWQVTRPAARRHEISKVTEDESPLHIKSSPRLHPRWWRNGISGRSRRRMTARLSKSG